MSITIHIPVTHRRFVQERKSVTVNAGTLNEALESLYLMFPEMKEQLIDKDGKLYAYIEVWVNNVPLFPWNPEFRLAQGDEIRISSFITGG